MTKLHLILAGASLLLGASMVRAEPPSDRQRVKERVVEVLELCRKATDWPEDATDQLLADLDADDGRLRWTAGWALGNGPPRVIPRLDEIARNGSPRQRRPAAMALSLLVASDSSALLSLWRMRTSSDAIEQYYLHKGIERVSLQQAGLRRTLLLLPEVMGIRPGDGYRPNGLTHGVRVHGTPWLHSVSWLELTLFQLGPPRVCDAPMLMELLQHEHPVTRRMAAEQIAMLGERAAECNDAVSTLLSDPDDEICIQALHTLKRIGGIGEITPETRRTIEKLLDDSFLLQPSPRLLGIELAIRSPRSRKLGCLALMTLVDLGVTDLSGKILAAIQSGAGRTEEENTVLSEALAKLTHKVPQDLIASLSSDDRRVRTAAARAVGAFGPRAGEVVPALKAAMRRELESDEVDTFATRRAIWLTLGCIGPQAKDAVGVLKEVLPTVPHHGWRKEVESAIASCRGERVSEPVSEKDAPGNLTRMQRRLRIKELLAHASDKSSLAHKPRNEAVGLLSMRYQAAASLQDVAASVVRDFICDMRGAARSREVAVERLRSSFNDMEEANVVLRRLHNSYRYRQVYRPYIKVARQALGLDRRPPPSSEAPTAFPDAVTASLSDPPDASSLRKLASFGPAGVPFLAAAIGHSERSLHVSVCLKLKSMGRLAVEATPALRKAVDGEHSKFTLMALQRINPSVYAEVLSTRVPSGDSVK